MPEQPSLPTWSKLAFDYHLAVQRLESAEADITYAENKRVDAWRRKVAAQEEVARLSTLLRAQEEAEKPTAASAA